MKSVVKSFEKWAKRNAPMAELGRKAELQSAYLAGRRDLQNEQKRRAKLEAERAQAAKQAQKRTWYEAFADELPKFGLTLLSLDWSTRKPMELSLLHAKAGGYPRLLSVGPHIQLRGMPAAKAAELVSIYYQQRYGRTLDKP